jgi:hypothetical protein
MPSPSRAIEVPPDGTLSAEIHGEPPKLSDPFSKDGAKGHCDECGKWHKLPAIHIDYVGHAYVTERLNAVDPAWTLEPSARHADGSPAFIVEDGTYGVWARLLLNGVVREEYGEGNTRKAAWSDVLKRCAMRFGVALDLWKQEQNSEETTTEAEPEETYGPCPLCGKGQIVRRQKRDGTPFAKCSLSNYRDKSTCQWVDWEPDFEAYALRASTTAVTPPRAPQQPRNGPAPTAERGPLEGERAALLADLMRLPHEQRMAIMRSPSLGVNAYRGQDVKQWAHDLTDSGVVAIQRVLTEAARQAAVENPL